MSERYACMCGHKPDAHSTVTASTCVCSLCDCEGYREYDYSDDAYTGPRGREADDEMRHTMDEARKLK